MYQASKTDNWTTQEARHTHSDLPCMERKLENEIETLYEIGVGKTEDRKTKSRMNPSDLGLGVCRGYTGIERRGVFK